jgi:uncharacterized cupredoxin-like copper-binding protein
MIGAITTLVLVMGVALTVVLTGGQDAPPATTAPFDGTTLKVILGDYLIAGDLTAPAGNVRLEAVNQGGIVHNVGIRRGPISGDMQPGRGFTIGLGSLAPGTYQLYCDIVGHVEQGMVADLVITGSG